MVCKVVDWFDEGVRDGTQKEGSLVFDASA